MRGMAPFLASATTVAQNSAPRVGPSVRIYFAVEPVDLRRGHDGLSGIVRGQWGMDLFAGHLFAFLGRRGDRCKILFWDRGGLVLYYERLEKGRFRVPRISHDGLATE